MKEGNKKTILVTGGAGFIGSHLCEKLLGQGNKVICLDNFFTGSRDNISHLLKNKNFTLIERDIINNFNYGGSLDQIYNLACPASPIAYQHDPVKTVKANVKGSINMLELAKEKSAGILQASTSEIYGDPLVHPQGEDYWGNVNPLSPRACYDEGKRCAETLFADYQREYGVDIKIVRIFNTYGPRMAKNDGRVVSNFIMQALSGGEITVYGDGGQTRSFQYIDDLVEGMIKMMEKNNFIGPVNIGNPGEFTIKELAERVIKLTGSKSNIVYGDLPEGDPKQRQPDISLAKKKLGWEPKIKLEEGLLKTIGYFKEILNK